MVTFEWLDRYNTGLEQIDDEHKSFLSLIARFSLALEQEHGNDRVSTLLDEVLSHAEEHFDHEIQLMRDEGYPGVAHHDELHQRLLSKLKGKISDYKSSKLGDEDFVDYLLHWFIDHTVHEDGKFTTFLQLKE